MIVKLTIDDKKAIQSLRLACKFFNTLELVEKHFHLTYLAHLHVVPTEKAFTRLVWTVRLPELSHTIQSITILYDNENFAESGALCSGMHANGKGDLLLEALEHFYHIGRSVDLNVTVAKTPLDATSSIIGIMHQVLEHLLFGYPIFSPPGVRRIILDIDDTSSAAFPILTDPSEDRWLAKDYGPKFQSIWHRMIKIGHLEQVQIRFSKKGETQSLRHLTIAQNYGRLDVGMRNLGTWHFDIMGRMSIFSEVFYMAIDNCAFEATKEADLFNFNKSRLQHMSLRNVSLMHTYRLWQPPRVWQEPCFWEDTFLNLAGTTTLQSLWAERLIDHDGSILHSQPWFLTGTPQRSVSDAIEAYYS